MLKKLKSIYTSHASLTNYIHTFSYRGLPPGTAFSSRPKAQSWPQFNSTTTEEFKVSYTHEKPSGAISQSIQDIYLNLTSKSNFLHKISQNINHHLCLRIICFTNFAEKSLLRNAFVQTDRIFSVGLLPRQHYMNENLKETLFILGNLTHKLN